MVKYPTIFTVTTPFQSAPTVALSSKTWEEHIAPFHPELEGKTIDVAATLRNPAIVCEASGPPRVIFASDTHSLGGKPLVVCVHPDGEHSQVVTAYYGGLKYLQPYNGIKVLWKRS